MGSQPETSAEEQAALLEESAEDLYENAPCGYLSTLPDGRIIKVNQTFLAWTGYARQELLSGKRFQELLSIGGRIFYETHFAPLLRMQGFIQEINLELLTKDRQPIPTLVNTVQHKDASGQPRSHRITVFNIADRKKYERELLLARKKAEQAAKAKADFLSMISHEIRTPMNAIIGVSNLLQDTPLSPQQEEYVRVLRSSSEHLLDLINDILDFSKIEAGKVTLEERSFDVRQLVYNTVYGLGLRAEAKCLPLRVEIDERVPAWLIGDPLKLGQLLTNLVSNAIKFTDTGRVTVALRVQELLAEAASIEFRVTDTGIGIAPDRLEHIFEEFTQASYDINLRYGGTGLGLAICQKLLALYGGRMSVESVLGEGSAFFFTLRLKIAQELGEAEGPGAKVLDARALEGVRVLVAEDNDVNVFVLSRFLRKWGVEFEVVGNGRLAVEKVQAGHHDLVLMDLQMPELDGYDATRWIRNLPGERFKRLPVIALSASTRIGLEDRMASAGFTDFVGKPFRPEELFKKIALYASPSGMDSSGPLLVAERKQAPRGSRTPSPVSGFSLKRFRELTDGDRQALVELSTITLKSCESYKQEFQEALLAGDRTKYEFHAHKIKVTLDLLQAQVLRAAVKEGQQLLEEAERERDPVRIRAVIETLQRELDVIIQALKEEMRER